MNKEKGITVGTYLRKTIRNSKDKGLSSKKICNHCKMKDKCKYRQITKFENGKVIDNNVECDSFYFSITSKAIVTTGRDTITGKRTTKTFVGKNKKEAFNKALSFQIEMEENQEFRIITKSNKTIIDLVKGKIEEDYKLDKIIKATHKRKSDTIKKLAKEKFTNKPISIVKKTDIHTHMLRGTFATRCAEAQIAPAVLKKILGHTDITVTMKYYVDVDVEFEKAENKNLEDYLIDKEIFNVASDYDYA